ncbi:MAG TPA: PspA/IM30 family protein [Bryobacteraceae bacterium]|nr:PspA/IM30 family protein [Bryobacteraceae bacterium]
MERVATLVRANLNDLIDKAEEPEKMLKQFILDMQNQLLQVKTQVAIAIADQHLLIKKQKEHNDKTAEWMKKAELAVSKSQDDLARTAIERSMSSKNMAESFALQAEDQRIQVENLKSALHKLDRKLSEAQAKAEVLVAQHRRARVLNKAGDARIALADGPQDLAWDRAKNKVEHAEALSAAKAELLGDSVEDRFASLERQQEVDRILTEIKARKS